jgi:demethylmenaquinone methyltransferase/2-methoxy-6-polyprenyl-1,4-benzoquinol methylase
MTLEQQLDEQIAYYRARSSEYDEWFLRQGRYDRGPELNAHWFEEVGRLTETLELFRPAGDVLELACGTGWWTERLARHAASLTAVDAAPEVLALNQARLGPGRVEYVQADLFSWRPQRQYDVVFFSFWLSHVPPERFEPFWEMVAAALRPGGRFLLFDSLPSDTSSAGNHSAPNRDETRQQRRLNDGSEHTIFKLYYEPQTLADRLGALGWHAQAGTTGQYFLYASGGRA